MLSLLGREKGPSRVPAPRNPNQASKSGKKRGGTLHKSSPRLVNVLCGIASRRPKRISTHQKTGLTGRGIKVGGLGGKTCHTLRGTGTHLLPKVKVGSWGGSGRTASDLERGQLTGTAARSKYEKFPTWDQRIKNATSQKRKGKSRRGRRSPFCYLHERAAKEKDLRNQIKTVSGDRVRRRAHFGFKKCKRKKT